MKEPIHETETMDEKVAAVLDLRSLAQRCLQLEEELRDQVRRNRDQETFLAGLDRQYDRLNEYARYGRQVMETKRRDALRKLRVIAHSTGQSERIQTLESVLAEENILPQDVERWHESIRKEFESAYPTTPLSCRYEKDTIPSRALTWQEFRMPVLSE